MRCAAIMSFPRLSKLRFPWFALVISLNTMSQRRSSSCQSCEQFRVNFAFVRKHHEVVVHELDIEVRVYGARNAVSTKGGVSCSERVRCGTSFADGDVYEDMRVAREGLRSFPNEQHTAPDRRSIMPALFL